MSILFVFLVVSFPVFAAFRRLDDDVFQLPVCVNKKIIPLPTEKSFWRRQTDLDYCAWTRRVPWAHTHTHTNIRTDVVTQPHTQTCPCTNDFLRWIWRHDEVSRASWLHSTTVLSCVGLKQRSWRWSGGWRRDSDGAKSHFSTHSFGVGPSLGSGCSLSMNACFVFWLLSFFSSLFLLQSSRKK